VVLKISVNVVIFQKSPGTGQRVLNGLIDQLEGRDQTVQIGQISRQEDQRKMVMGVLSDQIVLAKVRSLNVLIDQIVLVKVRGLNVLIDQIVLAKVRSLSALIDQIVLAKVQNLNAQIDLNDHLEEPNQAVLVAKIVQNDQMMGRVANIPAVHKNLPGKIAQLARYLNDYL